MKVQEEPVDLDRPVKNRGIIWAVLGTIVSALFFVCIFFETPIWIAVFIRGTFGYSSYFLPFFILYQSMVLYRKKPRYREKLFAGTLFYIALIIFISASYTPDKETDWYLSGISLNSGGYLGELLSMLLSLGLGDDVAKGVASVIALFGLLSVSNTHWFRTAIAYSYGKPYGKKEHGVPKERNILVRLSDYNHYAGRGVRLLEQSDHIQNEYQDPVISQVIPSAPKPVPNPAVPNPASPKKRAPEAAVSGTSPASLSRYSEPARTERPAIPLIGEPQKPDRDFGRVAGYFKSEHRHADSEPQYANKTERKTDDSHRLTGQIFSKTRENEREAFSASSSFSEKEHRGGHHRLDNTENIAGENQIAGTNHTIEKNTIENRTSENHTNDNRSTENHTNDYHTTENRSADNRSTDNYKAKDNDKKAERQGSHVGKKKSDRDGRQYSVPPTVLLDINSKGKADNSKFISEVIDRLRNVFKNFGVDADVVSYEEGPTITMFEVVLGLGVKISKLQNLSEDIALNLAAPTVRIAPIEGKSSVGIEVPNNETTAVSMREIIDDKEFVARRSPLNVVLGKDISGKPVVADLASMPHLLVAGATGSGKSVCVNAMILSILLNASPDEVRFVMIDPKQVELSNYNELPHLIMPVVTEPKQAAAALNWTVQEMERRYSLMLGLRVKDYKSYNQKCDASERLPYIVVIVDELADLMMAAAKQVEEAICRIAQKARAAGIHLVLATQRPSVDVITGLIKANIPSRIAFSVSSQVDSRTILDSSGAEKLLGKGDMLYHPVSLARAKRVQGAFVSTKEVDRVVAFIMKQGYRTEQITLDKLQHPDSSQSASAEDEYLEEAIRLVRETGKASASMLQRRFSIGYNRAARLIDMMEEMGIIGPQQGSKSREVF